MTESLASIHALHSGPVTDSQVCAGELADIKTSWFSKYTESVLIIIAMSCCHVSYSESYKSLCTIL